MEEKQIIWFLDFDGTITESDLCTKIPLLHNDKDLLEAWPHVSSEFSKLYGSAFDQMYSSLKERPKCDSPLQIIHEFIDSIDKVEMYGVEKTQKEGILKGFTHQQLWKLGSESISENRAAELIRFFKLSMQQCREHGSESHCFYVISANWSFDVIKGALETVLEKASLPDNQRFAVVPAYEQIQMSNPVIRVFSNNLEFEDSTPDAKSTGKIFLTCVTAKQKADFVVKTTNKMRQRYAKRNICSICIGDSLGDLLAMLASDIAIIFGDDSSFHKSCSDLFHIPIVPLHSLNLQRHFEKNNKIVKTASKVKVINLEDDHEEEEEEVITMMSNMDLNTKLSQLQIFKANSWTELYAPFKA